MINTDVCITNVSSQLLSYLGPFVSILHSCNANNLFKSFGYAVGQYADILDMSKANIGKKTDLLDTGKLRSVSKKFMRKKGLQITRGFGDLFIMLREIQ